MDLLERINQDLKAAMKQKDQYRLEALRAIKSELLLLKTAEGSQGQITEAQALKVLQKMVKQRKEAAELYKSKGRDDLAEQELMQAKVIEEYLPEQLSPQQLENELKKIIEQVGAKSIRDMGKVMAVATKQFAGRADNKLIADTVKKLLNQ